jgi:hypothetical protein
MNAGEIISSLISGIGVLILAAIGRAVLGLRGDFHRFMAEHVWLISTTLWTRDKVVRIMQRLDMPMDNPPPTNLPEGSKK